MFAAGRARRLLTPFSGHCRLFDRKLRRLPEPDQTAKPGIHVFIPWHGCAEGITQLFKEHSTVFLRAGVAVGKSTLAETLAREFPKEFIIVPYAGPSAATWALQLAQTTSKETGTALDPQSATVLTLSLQALAATGKVVIFDEAHTIFSSPDLVSCMFGVADNLRPKMLLLSASGEASTGLQSTPKEINGKYMWQPRMPEARELKDPLAEAGVNLDLPSIDFFLRFCAGIRGVFMAAMRWARDQQNGEDWNLHRTVANVRESCGFGAWHKEGSILYALASCRAVRVNGIYDSVDTIPKAFASILSEGSEASEGLTSESRRQLTIAGFLLPQSKGECSEFVKYDWRNDATRFSTSNALLASYYRNLLEARCNMQVRLTTQPKDCLNLLMIVLPYLHFATVVSFGSSPLSTGGLPFENDYTEALIVILKKLNVPAHAVRHHDGGKVDIACRVGDKSFALEAIMAERSPSEHNEHRQRFDPIPVGKANYSSANHKAVITIGTAEKVRDRVKAVRAAGVEIIGLSPNSAHTQYMVYYRAKDSNVGSEPCMVQVECDCVAKSCEFTDGPAKLKSIQRVVRFEPEGAQRAAIGSGPALPETVVISITCDGKSKKVKFRSTDSPAVIKEAISLAAGLAPGTIFELQDSEGCGVTISGSLPAGAYEVVRATAAASAASE